MVHGSFSCTIIWPKYMVLFRQDLGKQQTQLFHPKYQCVISSQSMDIIGHFREGVNLVGTRVSSRPLVSAPIRRNFPVRVVALYVGFAEICQAGAGDVTRSNMSFFVLTFYALPRESRVRVSSMSVLHAKSADEFIHRRSLSPETPRSISLRQATVFKASSNETTATDR